ncbi:hypothetical protein MA20_42820 [Bradyrhizobium japonicum]|uniref:Uncharacterized protein n=1 Tax=Bradyrhizobium japonicum TaxID=375 RepID=A0A0A3XKK9_BRAJP|nr:hypothetical protein [Bradyrhizobium japonicum]KGT73686.1 hypothetical protein MA20_42820 [Bradyrhizobium japonicum]
MTTAQQNEPTQQALDAFNLARIRAAQKEAESVNETNNSAKNKLRGVFAITQGQGLHNDAAREALKLVEGGEADIDAFCEKVRKIGVYVGFLGKTLTPRQYELFGMPAAGPAPEDERAENEGRAAGFRMDDEAGSKEQDNPYEVGSQKGQAWIKGFRKGRPERNTLLSMQKTEPVPGATAGDARSGEAS